MADEVKYTYSEWVEKGYHVLRGERSVERVGEQLPLF